jgi:predicted MPP superfamily phosphohydrolase
MLAPMRDLRARHGVFYVTGNHEYYHGDVQELVDGVQAAGAEPLNDVHRTIEINGAQLVIGGVTDFGAHAFRDDHYSDPRRAAAGAPEAAFRLLLAHQPRSAVVAAAAGWNFMLAGHTHGGQFWPWTWMIGLFHPVAVGLGAVGGMPVYVSRGTGTWGPPVRLGAPAELTEIVLRRR